MRTLKKPQAKIIKNSAFLDMIDLFIEIHNVCLLQYK